MIQNGILTSLFIFKISCISSSSISFVDILSSSLFFFFFGRSKIVSGSGFEFPENAFGLNGLKRFSPSSGDRNSSGSLADFREISGPLGLLKK